MRVTSKWLTVLFLLAIVPMTGCNFLSKLRARDNINKGGKMFANQKYDAATQYFEKAIELDPELEEAHMHLAMANMAQFIPGSTDPKSEQMAANAIKEFSYVVSHAKDPSKPNLTAMISIANLYYQMKKYEESKSWCNRILASYIKNAEAYYRIAVIDYDSTLEKTGLEGENVEFLKPEEKATTLKNIEEALNCLNKALEIRPDYFDAMEYQNLLWREKVKFEKDPKAKEALIQQADAVFAKSLAIRKAKKEEAAKQKKFGVTGGK
jgi:tetratricopeptide (TPR) repeat protein